MKSLEQILRDTMIDFCHRKFNLQERVYAIDIINRMYPIDSTGWRDLITVVHIASYQYSKQFGVDITAERNRDHVDWINPMNWNHSEFIIMKDRDIPQSGYRPGIQQSHYSVNFFNINEAIKLIEEKSQQSVIKPML